MTRRVLLQRVLPAVLALAALTLAGFSVGARRQELWADLQRIGVGSVVVAFVAGVLGIGVLALLWRQVLIGLGAHAPLGPLTRVFLISQIGKYLPGSVWPVLAQIELGRRAGVSRRRLLAANVLALVLNLAVGMVLAGVLLPLSSRDSLRHYWWTFVFLPLLVLLLHPRLIPALIDKLFVRFAHEPLDARLPLRDSLAASGWGVLSWAFLGFQIYVLARPFGASGPSALAAATGGMCLALVAGILFIPAPAGAGVRDAVLVATLAPSIGGTSALAVALVSRVLLIIVDLVLAGASLILPKGAVAAQPTSDVEASPAVRLGWPDAPGDPARAAARPGAGRHRALLGRAGHRAGPDRRAR